MPARPLRQHKSQPSPAALAAAALPLATVAVPLPAWPEHNTWLPQCLQHDMKSMQGRQYG